MATVVRDDPLSRVRADALPEHIRYQDHGCDIHPQCLTCPLPRCRYDEPGGLRALLNAQRDQQVVSLRRRGESVDAIARRFRLSRRTVFRILSARDERKGNGRCRPWPPISRTCLPAGRPVRR